MRWLHSIAGAACLWLALGAAAHAAMILRLDTSSSLTINSGATAIVDLYLDDDANLINMEGLATGGARLLLGALSTATVTANTVTPNAGFDQLSLTIYPLSLPLDPFTDSAPSGYSNLSGFFAMIDLLSSPVGVGTNSVLLGSFSLTITGSPGDTATLLPATLANDPTDFLAFIGNTSGDPFSADLNFDELVELVEPQTGLKFTIAAPSTSVVPEPASFLLFAAFGTMTLVATRRRRAPLAS